MTPYLLDCPSCGQQLTPSLGDWQTPPWACHIDHRLFWVEELLPLSRQNFRPQYHDFGYGDHNKGLVARRYAETIAAQLRGTSVREEQLGLLDKGTLEGLMKRKKIDPGFMELIKAEHGRRVTK